VLQVGASLEPRVSLVCVAEPDAGRNAEQLSLLARQGVAAVGSIDDLLSRDDVEAVWLPVPIALHRTFTEKAIAAGKPVLCEKALAGSVQDVDALIAARNRRPDVPAVVAFQHIYDPVATILKRRILDGAIGEVRSVSIAACSPRGADYYTRNKWAGRYQQNGTWVLDSPVQNALAHFVHLALFLLGRSQHASAAPTRVAAELYRASPRIETYDTASLRVTLGTHDVPMLVLLTHACGTQTGPAVRINGTRGAIDLNYQNATIRSVRRAEEVLTWHGNNVVPMLERFARLVRGIDDPDRGVVTFEMARAHTVIVNAASEAAAVVNVPDEFLRDCVAGQHRVRAIEGIESAFADCAGSMRMLHESGRFPFTRPAGEMEVAGYAHLGSATTGSSPG